MVEKDVTPDTAELLKAYNEKRVAILPCACGDKIYTMSVNGITMEHTVVGFSLEGNEVWLIDTEIEIAGSIYQRNFELTDLNKTFFFSKEELSSNIPATSRYFLKGRNV